MAMAMMKEESLKPCVLLTFSPIVGIPSLLPSLQQRFTVLRLDEAPDLPSFLALHSATSILALVTFHASAHLLRSLPNLRLVVCAAAGYDNIDLAYCREKGISVTNLPAVSNDDVADFAILLMLAVFRRLTAADRYVRQGLWSLRGHFTLTRKASERRVGIVGLGQIGLAIAKRAEAFGCSISYHGRSSKPNVPYVFYSDILVLATNSDVIIVSCPLTNETKHLIGRKVLDALGPQGTLVNIARGSVIDEAELVAALKEGRLGAAALDVFENEPNVPMELFEMDNVVLTPHSGSGTKETRRVMADLVVANIEACFSGKPLLTPVT